jgi:hypothetical protein
MKNGLNAYHNQFGLKLNFKNKNKEPILLKDCENR